LMALMVAAILLTVLSPLVVLSTSYRVQARRIDLATQAARSYIDGLRSDSIGTPSLVTDFTVDPLTVLAQLPRHQLRIDVGNCLDKISIVFATVTTLLITFSSHSSFRNGRLAEIST
jgi:type II secretory pathway pseudopilin PulG